MRVLGPRVGRRGSVGWRHWFGNPLRKDGNGATRYSPGHVNNIASDNALFVRASTERLEEN